MNTRQENKFSMYLLIKVLLNTFNIVWAGIPGFVLAVNEFLTKTGEIDGAVQVQEKKITGYAKNKKTAKRKMVKKALEIGGALKKHATDINDSVLFDAVNWTESQLMSASDTIVKERCMIIYNLANTYAADLLPEGITPIIIGELNTLMTDYDSILGTPSQAKVDKKEATANLKVYIKKTDIILKNKIDLLMLQFKDSNSSFYDKYVIDRKVINLGTQHTRLSGVIVNSDGDGIDGAVISIEGTDIVKTSGVDGVYLFKPFIPGDYNVRVEKGGYVTVTEFIHVSPGQHFVLNVTLEHIVYTGIVNSGQVVNVLNVSTPGWMPGARVRIKNTTSTPGVNSMNYYPANNPGDGFSGQGSQLSNGQEEIHIVTAAEFKACLNIYNPSPNEGTYEVTIL